MTRLIIGQRRLRSLWISVDDVFQVENGREEIQANHGARAILEKERDRFKGEYVNNKTFQGIQFDELRSSTALGMTKPKIAISF